MGAQARTAIPFLAAAVRGGRSVSNRTPPPGSLVKNLKTPSTVQVLTPPPEGGSAEENARIYAAQALGRIGAIAAPALGELYEASQYGSEALRQAALTAIRLIEIEDQ